MQRKDEINPSKKGLNDVILLTGGKGFLGGYLEAELTGKAYVLTPSRLDLDLCSRPAVWDYFTTFRPTVVIHAAGLCGGIKANIEQPASFIYANTVMGMNVLDAAAAFGVRRVVNVGSACSYPESVSTANLGLTPGILWDGRPQRTHAPYGLAKRVVIEAGQAFARQYGMEVVNFLLANLYGPGCTFDPVKSHVIPALVAKLAIAKAIDAPSVKLWGTGKPMREFLYVEDAARGIVDLGLTVKEFDDPINLGSGHVVTIEALADEIAELVGYEGEIQWDHGQPDGQYMRYIDSSKAKELGFVALKTMQEGLEETVADYLARHPSEPSKGSLNGSSS